jgi:hypothetical protein
MPRPIPVHLTREHPYRGGQSACGLLYRNSSVVRSPDPQRTTCVMCKRTKYYKMLINPTEGDTP